MNQNEVTNGSSAPETKAVSTSDLWKQAKAARFAAKADRQQKSQALVTQEALEPASASVVSVMESIEVVAGPASDVSELVLAAPVVEDGTALVDDTTAGAEETCVDNEAVGAVSVVPTTNATESLPAIVDIANDGAVAPGKSRLLFKLLENQCLVRAQNGAVYFKISPPGRNPYAIALGSRQGDVLISEAAAKHMGVLLRRSQVGDIRHYYQGWAEKECPCSDVWFRVAAIPGGVEIDSGDEAHTHFRVTAKGVEILASGSAVIFYRTAAMLPMAMPAEVGNLDLLKKYIPVHPVAYIMVLGWTTFTLGNSKLLTVQFLILWLQGAAGTIKSSIAKRLLELIDPTKVGVQKLHKKEKDLAIATQGAHVVAFDNLRMINDAFSDLLCVVVTGGSVTSRTLYTDFGQTVLNLQAALILTSIHPIVNQPDLAQRVLQLHLGLLPENKRRSDKDLAAEFAADLPAILRGLLELIAKIYAQLPNAQVTRPTRMIEFSKWLAAMEIVYGAPTGAFQDVYCDTLIEGQRDTLQACVLAAGVLDFAENHMQDQWSGSPSEFLEVLNSHATQGTQKSPDWPRNPIALSRRLMPLQSSLRSQGVALELSRGKHRTITITKTIKTEE